MLTLLFAMLMEADTLAHHTPTAVDPLRTDTLREVVVRPDSVLPVVKAIEESLRRNPVPKSMTLADVLERISPGINDKITHPFAIKQRKKERHRRRMIRALEQFDKVESFGDLLMKAYEQQMLEDSLLRIKRE